MLITRPDYINALRTQNYNNRINSLLLSEMSDKNKAIKTHHEPMPKVENKNQQIKNSTTIKQINNNNPKFMDH